MHRRFVALAALALAGCGDDPTPAAAPLPSPPIESPPTVAPTPPPKADDWTDRALAAVAALKDEDLKDLHDGVWDSRVPGPWQEKEAWGFMDRASPGELALNEAVRRGGKEWETWLESKARNGTYANIRSLTSLRRLKGKPDPLEVLVEPREQNAAVWPELPLLKVVLRNAETEGPDLLVTPLSDYRGGFLRHFRMEIRDGRGAQSPVLNRSGESGGAETVTILPPGATWKRTLDSRDYVPRLQPGDYECRVQYAENSWFSGIGDLRGHIYWTSQPLRLSIARHPIDVTVAEKNDLRFAISKLSTDGPFRIVMGMPVEECPDFIAPDSPEARILRAGWKAVPSLLDALEVPGVDPRRRAWIFFLLYGITGTNDPRWSDEDFDGTSGVFSGGWLFNSWETRIGRPRPASDGRGAYFVSNDKGDCPKLDIANQDRFAARWKKAREYLDIRVR